ncbi:hypothetical protein SAMN04488515_0343 [Cognatiyoonia koreensis]|uniref:Uncharacterized protein n=1 Tax=Cognatiyoonia koreensis TaxID=364200 RepID=A0A1I0N094_9RHOB|nr:hypothetical protein [Cognatiyoonia koreensis]SEV94442.1 hypothetical protein SAMN04488515_0343 [Cognatiyoonia koreensis]
MQHIQIEVCESLPTNDALNGQRAKGLIADTLTPNVEMRDLYPKLGLVEPMEPIDTTTY